MAVRLISFLIFFYIVCLGSVCRAFEGDTYGQLLIDDSADQPVQSYQAEFSAGYDVTNPYLNTYSLDGEWTWAFHPLFAAGVEALVFTSTRSQYNQNLQNNLGVFGISANEDRPRFETFGIFKAKVLSGRVNLFGAGALPFVLGAKLGAGSIWSSDRQANGALTWGIEQQLFFSPRWGGLVRFDQDVQFGGSGTPGPVYRNRVALGGAYNF
jgi:hypothetical protein